MNRKLAELILYMAKECGEDPAFGATKLNKMLFIADFFAYGVLGKPVTGATYVRMQYGPMPKEVFEARDLLVDEGRAKVEKESRYLGRTLQRLVALAEPDLTMFTSEELEFVHQAIGACTNRNGTELSGWSHELNPWKDALHGEEIPYETVFVLQDVPVSREALEWGIRRMAEMGVA